MPRGIGTWSGGCQVQNPWHCGNGVSPGPPHPRAALKSVRAIPNPRPEDRRPKETRRPRSELIATPAEQQPIELGHSRNSDLSGFGLWSSDYKAAEHDLPSTGRTFEQPCPHPSPSPPRRGRAIGRVVTNRGLQAARAPSAKAPSPRGERQRRSPTLAYRAHPQPRGAASVAPSPLGRELG